MNPRRDPNPFTPSSEPEWVMQPESSIPQRLMNQKSDAGIAKSVNYDVSAEPTKSTLSEGAHASSRALLNVQEQHIKSQSLAVSAPSTSNSTKTPAPLPFRKPIEFTVSNERNLELSSSDTRDSAAALSVQSHGIRSTLIHLSSINAPPRPDKPLPASQWSIPCFPTTNGVPLSDQTQAGRTLALPRRPAQASSGSSDLLEDDNVGAQHIPSLQPIRRK